MSPRKASLELIFSGMRKADHHCRIHFPTISTIRQRPSSCLLQHPPTNDSNPPPPDGNVNDGILKRTHVPVRERRAQHLVGPPKRHRGASKEHCWEPKQARFLSPPAEGQAPARLHQSETTQYERQGGKKRVKRHRKRKGCNER